MRLRSVDVLYTVMAMPYPEAQQDWMVQVIMPQGVSPVPPAPVSVSLRSGPFAPRPLGRPGSALAFLLLLFTGLTAPLRAQSRGDLQVAARVLDVQPSRLALTQGLTAARQAPAFTFQSLATIQVESAVTKTRRLPVGRWPRAVVTISFLRN
jgi:hypothetical protein